MLKEVAGDYMIIPLANGNMNATKIFNINESGAFIYKKLCENISVDEIAKLMMKEYKGLDLNTALNDINEFIDLLKEKGIYND